MKFHGGITAYKPPKPRISYKGKTQKTGLGPIKKPGFGATQTGPAPVGPPHAPKPAPPVGVADDAAYETQANNLNTRYANQDLALTGQEQQIKQDYGFDPEYASNPYTKANMLARAASQRFTGTTNAMASRGQLYSGATNNARAADQFASDAQMNDARNSYAQALIGIQNSRLSNTTDRNLGLADARQSLNDRLTASTPDASIQPTPDYPNDYPTDIAPKHRKYKKKGKKK